MSSGFQRSWFPDGQRCSRLRPDAVNYELRIVRELKPDTPDAVARGWRQVNAYKAYLEEITDQTWTAYVDTYKP